MDVMEKALRLAMDLESVLGPEVDGDNTDRALALMMTLRKLFTALPEAGRPSSVKVLLAALEGCGIEMVEIKERLAKAKKL